MVGCPPSDETNQPIPDASFPKKQTGQLLCASHAHHHLRLTPTSSSPPSLLPFTPQSLQAGEVFLRKRGAAAAEPSPPPPPPAFILGAPSQSSTDPVKVTLSAGVVPGSVGYTTHTRTHVHVRVCASSRGYGLD